MKAETENQISGQKHKPKYNKETDKMSFCIDYIAFGMISETLIIILNY